MKQLRSFTALCMHVMRYLLGHGLLCVVHLYELRHESPGCSCIGPSPPGLQGWPVLDSNNKTFHSLKIQRPTSCSLSLYFPVTHLSLVLPHSPIHPQTFSEHPLWVRSGARDTKTTRLLPVWRKPGPWWVLKTTEAPCHQAVRSSLRTRLGKLWLV